jgi:electron transfer flavoprotein beta subunit
MDIVVLIKQVPETANVRMDEATGTMIREGHESIVNPLDLYAVEAGIRLKERYGGRMVAVTMGPPDSVKALREVIAMGCDDAVQVSHKSFAGADTWATSYTLSQAIRHRVGSWDLVLCGERATDGETGQVGPGVASFLDLPLATFVGSISVVEGGRRIRVRRLVEGGHEVLSLPLPALLSVVKEINFPRLPTLRGKQRARTAEIPVVGPAGIGVGEERVGLSGSPTRVVRISRPRLSRQGERFTVRGQADGEATADRLIDFLRQKGLI